MFFMAFQAPQQHRDVAPEIRIEKQAPPMPQMPKTPVKP